MGLDPACPAVGLFPARLREGVGKAGNGAGSVLSFSSPRSCASTRDGWAVAGAMRVPQGRSWL